MKITWNDIKEKYLEFHKMDSFTENMAIDIDFGYWLMQEHASQQKPTNKVCENCKHFNLSSELEPCNTSFEGYTKWESQQKPMPSDEEIEKQMDTLMLRLGYTADMIKDPELRTVRKLVTDTAKWVRGNHQPKPMPSDEQEFHFANRVLAIRELLEYPKETPFENESEAVAVSNMLMEAEKIRDNYHPQKPKEVDWDELRQDFYDNTILWHGVGTTKNKAIFEWFKSKLK